MYRKLGEKKHSDNMPFVRDSIKMYLHDEVLCKNITKNYATTV